MKAFALQHCMTAADLPHLLMLLLVPSSLPYPVFLLSPRVDLLLLSIITLAMVNRKVQKNY
jgi:hypothetical protein